MTQNTLTVAPMRDVTALSRVPGPFRNAYRVLFPEELRIRVHGLLLHGDDMMRTATFWANPWERKRSSAELWGCQTPEDCYTFATAHMAHQQWKQEIVGLLNFANEQRPVRICELGLFLGGTNLMLTHALPDVRQIIGVDMWIRNKSQLKYYKKRSQQQTLITGKTCDKTTLEKVAGALHGEKLDLLLIDADHSYAGAKADFLQYRHFVREGGLIAFHDIVQDHLTRYGHDPATFVGSRSGEVYLLWRRLKACCADTREFVANYDQDGCGIGALVYSSKVDVPDNL